MRETAVTELMRGTISTSPGLLHMTGHTALEAVTLGSDVLGVVLVAVTKGAICRTFRPRRYSLATGVTLYHNTLKVCPTVGSSEPSFLSHCLNFSNTCVLSVLSMHLYIFSHSYADLYQTYVPVLYTMHRSPDYPTFHAVHHLSTYWLYILYL